MLRITTINEDTPTVTLKVEGRICFDLLMTLKSECERWLELDRTIELDFSGVTFVDAQGVELVRNLLSNRVRLTSCPALIQILIDEETTP